MKNNCPAIALVVGLFAGALLLVTCAIVLVWQDSGPLGGLSALGGILVLVSIFGITISLLDEY